MNKKLLLSFAVFAASFGVNAQNFVENDVLSAPVKIKKESQKRTEVAGDVSYYYYENNSRITKELNDHLANNPVQVQTGPTTFEPLFFDTLGFYSYSVKPKNNGSAYWQRAVQGFPLNAPAKLNSVRFLGLSKAASPATTSNVKVTVFDKKMVNALATKTLVVDNVYGYKTVVFDAPVDVTDTILVAFEMEAATDLFNIAYTHSYFNGQKLKAYFAGDTTDLKNQPVFLSDLPFYGDAAILATKENNAGILGLIKSNFDFFIFPNFTYDIKSDFQASKTSICLGDSVSFKSAANTGHLFNPVLNYIHWDFLANKAKPAYTVFDFGNGKDYTDSLANGVVFNSAGVKKVIAKTMIGTWSTAPYTFEDSTLFDITVNELPVAKATVTAAKCAGKKATVLVEGSNGTSPYTGIGSFEVAAVAGTLKYAIVDDKACKSDSVSATILDAPSAIALDSNAVIASNDVTADGKAIVIATGGTAPYSYSWADRNETNDTIVVGKGSYKAYVKDANNCATFATITVGAGTASVADLAIKGLAIYPNPVASQLNVTFNANSAATVELLNVAGQVIESKNTTNVVNTSFNTEKLTSGVYFVSIKVAEGTFTQKVIKD